MITFNIELVTLNANADVLNTTKTTVDGAGFVGMVDSLTRTYGKSDSTSEFIHESTGFVTTIWFPIDEAAATQIGLRIFNQTADFMRQTYRDFRKEACGRCGGSGTYGGSFDVRVGRVVGGIGQCFRCKGHGKVTAFQNALGDMSMALFGSGIATPSYEEFCREYRQYQSGGGETRYVNTCSVCNHSDVLAPATVCADCSEDAVSDFEAEAVADLPDFVLDDGTYTMGYVDETSYNGRHFTFRIRTVKTGKLAGKRVAEYLSGPDNSLDFQTFAFVNPDTLNVWKKFERGSLVNRAREIEALARNHREALEAAGIAYAERSSRCRRCNKVLTVPASLAAGYGPDCAAIIGIQYGETRSSDRASSSVVDSILSSDYLADLSDDELDDRIDSVTRAAARGEHYDEITNALEGERQRRIESGLYNVRVEGSEIVSDRPVTLVEAWEALSPEDRKIALREINIGFQEEMNRVNAR